MEIKLYQLTQVSNNSRLTSDILKVLNEKLSDKEKRDFEQWLYIVRQTKK